MHFQWAGNLSLVILTFDLDIQIRPSEGPNTSSLWIWRKSVQPFPRYMVHKQKSKQKVTALKQNIMQFTGCGQNRWTFGKDTCKKVVCLKRPVCLGTALRHSSIRPSVQPLQPLPRSAAAAELVGDTASLASCRQSTANHTLIYRHWWQQRMSIWPRISSSSSIRNYCPSLGQSSRRGVTSARFPRFLAVYGTG